MNSLIKNLKENNEDFEFYPTSKEMIKSIFDNIEYNWIKVLDIGCGTCNFKKYYDELAEEEYVAKYEKAKLNYREEYENKVKEWEEKYNAVYDRKHNPYYELSKSAVDKYEISDYFVIEKSQILINKLDKETLILGTDFYNTTLIDKPVDIVFCNPPYSDFKNWMYKIIDESNCYDIYLVVPQRWKDDERITNLLKKRELKPEILMTTDFLNAERQARAKVDILCIKKKSKTNSYYRNESLTDVENTAFEEWFNSEFNVKEESTETESLYKHEQEQKKKDKIRNQLVSGQDKAETLVNLYDNEIKTLFNHFKAICSLDIDILQTMGINKDKIMTTIKEKTKNLKLLYWKIIFDELEEITDRLTEKSRTQLFEKFTSCHTIDFTKENIYAIIIWVIKNSNNYYNEQLIDFYKDLSSFENCKLYKSNQKTFNKEEWKYTRISETNLKYVLDYRIICHHYLIGINYSYGSFHNYKHRDRLKDFKAIFKNLGFRITYIEECKDFGIKYYAYGEDDKQLFEYKCYKNGNIHIKFNIEFTKALNVEVSRLLGWIKNKEDISKEFPAELSKNAEKYFKINCNIGIEGGLKLLN